MMAAGVTAAPLVDRAIVLRIAGVLDVETSLAREKLTVPCVPRGQHAIEHVDAAGDAFDQVFGRAGAHQIPRPIGRQPPRRVADDGIHDVEGFSNAEAPDGISLEFERDARIDALVPQILEDASLDDTDL